MHGSPMCLYAMQQYEENLLFRSDRVNRLQIQKQNGHFIINPLDSKGNYSATSNNTKSVQWPLTDGLLHLEQRGWAWVWAAAPPCPLLAVPNVTAHPSTASVPVHEGPLLCGFNVDYVAIKRLNPNHLSSGFM